ncbi:MAG: HDOD domain-containing protein [Campylobacterota bacterium]|nr:HDOD domain-containing protein [Campylobacterota bacterium]
MKDFLQKKIKQLPPLPESAMQIEAVYHNSESTFNDMVQILEQDPLLTADILKAANSPLYGFSREINAISQAVSLFGMGTVRGFALASIVKNSFTLELSPYGISNEQFSALSKKQHALITSWFLKKEPKLLGILSPAAFLVEIGKVFIAQYLIEKNIVEAFKTKVEELNGDIEAAEVAITGMQAPEVSAAIFSQWRFETALIDTIANCTNPNNALEEDRKTAQILHVVRVAISITGQITPKSSEAAKTLIKEYGLDMESFETALANSDG